MFHSLTSFSKVSLPEVPVFHDVPRAIPLSMKFVDIGKEQVRSEQKIRIYLHGRVIRLLDRGNSLICAQDILQRDKGRNFSISSQLLKTTTSIAGGEQTYAFLDVPAEESGQFCSYLASQERLYVPFYDLQDILNSLVLAQIINQDTKKYLEQIVPTILTEELFLERVIKTRDEQMALALACRYAEEGKWMFAAKWLAKTKEILLEKEPALYQTYLEGIVKGSFADMDQQLRLYKEACMNRTSLNTYVDLVGFWRKISKISGCGIKIFFPKMEELVDAAAASGTIKEVCLQTSSPSIRQSLEGLGRFIKNSSTVEAVTISDSSFSSSKEDILPLLSGLLENVSLRRLIIRDYAIGDEGVCKLADTLLSNKDSKIDYIELALNDMTEMGVCSLIKLMAAKPSLHVKLIEPLSVSREFQEKVSKEFGDRLAIFYPKIN